MAKTGDKQYFSAIHKNCNISDSLKKNSKIIISPRKSHLSFAQEKLTEREKYS
jgi:hypothetical protein